MQEPREEGFVFVAAAGGRDLARVDGRTERVPEGAVNVGLEPLDPEDPLPRSGDRRAGREREQDEEP